MAIGGEAWRDGDCPQRMSDRAMRPERIRPAALGLLALILLSARPAAADPDGFNQVNLRFNLWHYLGAVHGTIAALIRNAGGGAHAGVDRDPPGAVRTYRSVDDG